MKIKEKTGITASAFFAGAVNGLMGTGGGIILLICLTKLLKIDFKSAISCTLVCTLFMSLASTATYIIGGNADLNAALPFMLSAIFGGAVGGVILKKIDSGFLNTLFCILIIIAGGRVII